MENREHHQDPAPSAARAQSKEKMYSKRKKSKKGKPKIPPLKPHPQIPPLDIAEDYDSDELREQAALAEAFARGDVQAQRPEHAGGGVVYVGKSQINSRGYLKSSLLDELPERK